MRRGQTEVARFTLAEFTPRGRGRRLSVGPGILACCQALLAADAAEAEETTAAPSNGCAPPR